MFIRKKKQKSLKFDTEKFQPALKASICTGEKVAGFIERETGKFEDVMLVCTEEDLQEFRETYDIKEELKKIY